jgi:hypothetical protein
MPIFASSRQLATSPSFPQLCRSLAARDNPLLSLFLLFSGSFRWLTTCPSPPPISTVCWVANDILRQPLFSPNFHLFLAARGFSRRPLPSIHFCQSLAIQGNLRQPLPSTHFLSFARVCDQPRLGCLCLLHDVPQVGYACHVNNHRFLFERELHMDTSW